MENIPVTNFTPSRFAALRRVLYWNLGPGITRDGVAISPYLTHGLITPAELLGIWNDRLGLTLQDECGQHLLRREFFQHVWRHRQDGIFNSITPQTETTERSDTVPTDIRMGATGVPVVDNCVRRLYSFGYLSYSQRTWLASYIYHYRKIDWPAGAAWMYGHLLDGDLASNALSWQSVAGTFGHSPLFVTSDLIERHSPELASRGSAIDMPYEIAGSLARSSETVASNKLRPLPQREPPLFARPPGLPTTADISLLVRKRKVKLVHPWNIAPHDGSAFVLGIIHLPFHIRFPWSALRWQFVVEGMRRVCDLIWVGDLDHSARWMSEADIITTSATLNPEYQEALQGANVMLEYKNQPWPEPTAPCASFSAYQQTIMRSTPELFRSPLAQRIEHFRRDR